MGEYCIYSVKGLNEQMEKPNPDLKTICTNLIMCEIIRAAREKRKNCSFVLGKLTVNDLRCIVQVFRMFGYTVDVKDKLYIEWE